MSDRSWLLTTNPRRRVRDAKPFAVAAVVLLVVGAFCVLIELQSSSRIYWTGQRVTGTNEGGLVYYAVDGRPYTMDAPGPVPSRPVTVAVWVDQNDPNQARIDQPARWFDAAFVLAPFVAAAFCVVVWAGRRGRRRSSR